MSLVQPVEGFAAGGVVTVSLDVPAAVATCLIVSVDEAARQVGLSPSLGPGFAAELPIFVDLPGMSRLVTDSSAIQPVDGSGLILESVASLEPGQTATVSQPGRTICANRRLAAVQGAGRILMWEQPLVPDMRPGPGLSFATGASTAGARFLAETGNALMDVRASSPGAWGNRLLVRVVRGVGTTALTAGPQPADRGSSAVQQLTGFTKGDLVRVSQAGARPPFQHLVVLDLDPVSRRLIWASADADVAQWSAQVDDAFDLAQPIRFERIDTSLTVSAAGNLVAVYPGLSLLSFHPRFAPEVLGRDAGAPIQVFPATDPNSGSDDLSPLNSAQWLGCGRDGIAALSAADMIGGADGTGGIAALSAVDEVAILAAPDAFLARRPLPEFVTPPAPVSDPCLPCDPIPTAVEPPPDPVELPPNFDLESGYRVQSALVEQCETLRDRFAVLDAPRPLDSLEEGVAAVRDWRR